MAKNDFLRKQRARDEAVFEAGERIGMQRMWDAVQLALRNPEVMSKDTFGRQRLEKFYAGIKGEIEQYHKAFTKDVEADYLQEKLDAALGEIWGEDLTPFHERYSELKQYGYDKAQKGWK